VPSWKVYDRYDPWYVKMTFGVFVTLVVGFLTILHSTPNYITSCNRQLLQGCAPAVAEGDVNVHAI
jgi:hypothetical protein